ncbi:hypothetical protein ACB094_02G121900 [Castanea mollissima]
MSTATATESQQQQQPLIPSLPDDVGLNILARIPRWHHPTLSLVSKPIHSLLSSPLFFTTRSLLLHSSQPLLYLSLRSSLSSSLLWFTLSSNSNSNSSHSLFPIPPIPSTSTVGCSIASLGPSIYVIGGSANDVPTSHVWILDCRFHTWRPGPNMRVAREFSAAGVVDENIYVMGGCVTDSRAKSAHWAERFDPNVQKWERVESPVLIRDKWMHASAVMDGKVYAMADRGGIVYDARESAWGRVEGELDFGWRGRACVVGGVLYCYDYLGKIRGFHAREGAWREVKGLEGGLPRFLCGATMANLGGKLVVLWEEKGKENGKKEMEIWCAEIGVEMRESGELWGEIGWVEKVRTVPGGSSIVHCVAVEV